jgi:hypothetical protein
VIPETVLWIDPGKDTGLAILRAYGRYFEVGEYGFERAGSIIYSLCATHQRNLAIGWERFVIGPSTHKKSPDAHHAIEMIGIARYFATVWRCQILPSAAPGDRDPATMEKLKLIGWWVPGCDDAQSAAQHMLAYLVRTRQVPPRESAILAAARAQAG